MKYNATKFNIGAMKRTRGAPGKERDLFTDDMHCGYLDKVYFVLLE